MFWQVLMRNFHFIKRIESHISTAYTLMLLVDERGLAGLKRWDSSGLDVLVSILITTCMLLLFFGRVSDQALSLNFLF